MSGRQPHPPDASITLRLDRWASLLNNEWGHEDELEDLAILCTQAANTISVLLEYVPPEIAAEYLRAVIT